MIRPSRQGLLNTSTAFLQSSKTPTTRAQSAEVAEYTDCISADFPNECPGYGTKQSDGEAPVMLELWVM